MFIKISRNKRHGRFHSMCNRSTVCNVQVILFTMRNKKRIDLFTIFPSPSGVLFNCCLIVICTCSFFSGLWYFLFFFCIWCEQWTQWTSFTLILSDLWACNVVLPCFLIGTFFLLLQSMISSRNSRGCGCFCRTSCLHANNPVVAFGVYDEQEDSS